MPQNKAKLAQLAAIEEILGQYWDLAFTEGSTGVNQSEAANGVLHNMRRLLDQPEGEPVAHVMGICADSDEISVALPAGTKLYTHPPAPRKLITADNVAEWLRDMDKPTCLYTLCANDSATPQTLKSGCSGAVLWYLGDDGEGEYPKFCHHCGAKAKKEAEEAT